MQPMPERGETVILVLMAAFILPVLLMAIVDALRPVVPGLAAVRSTIGLVVTPVVFSLLAVVRRRRLLGTDAYRTERSQGKSALTYGLAVGAVAFVSNVALSSASITMVGWLLGSEKSAEMAALEQSVTLGLLSGSPLKVAWVVLIFVLVTPIAEELLFRGYVYAALRHRFDVKSSIVASGLLFAAFHMYIIQFLPVFAAGVLFAWVYEKTGTLIAPTVAHATVNAIVVGALLLQLS